MKILLASSELYPFSKTGGLADMAGALGKALVTAGHEVVIVTPLYRGILAKYPQIRRVQAGLWSVEPQPGLRIFFVDCPEFFDRSGIYHERNISYPDNADRFIYLSKCVVHFARYLP